MNLRSYMLAGTVGIVLLVSGCSSEDKASDETSQVVATVDGTELTAAQFDTRMRQLPPGADPRNPAVEKQVLRSFIDEVLLAKTADDAGYAKRPAVARQLEQARNSILAREYLAQTVPVVAVDSREALAYYDSHSYMYAGRRGYRLIDLSIGSGMPGAQSVIAAMTNPSASIDTVAAAAKAQGIELRPQAGAATSDQLPEQLGRGLASRAVGDSVTYNLLGQQHFTRIEAIENAPVTFEQVKRELTERVKSERRDKAIAKKIDDLRKGAKISFGGLGQKIMAGTAKPTNRPAQSQTTPDQKKTIEKGAAGI
ncbi:MAG: hypothetical protein EOO77_00045 [Oxalobacteraceae bacterium]|nr:MAG: hypothetical protein EOO77_00045 [Oxalobacteraceae bacterium]